MTQQDLKIGILNATAFLVSFMDRIETMFQIILLFVSIIFTGLKAYEAYQNIRKKNEANKQL